MYKYVSKTLLTNVFLSVMYSYILVSIVQGSDSQLRGRNPDYSQGAFTKAIKILRKKQSLTYSHSLILLKTLQDLSTSQKCLTSLCLKHTMISYLRFKPHYLFIR